jgi:2-oxo-4-hydroxy-4-carboxy-5-ureidoimidazoline decarboxylase
MSLIDKINQLTKNDFASIFGNVFEKSNWIAEKVYEQRPFSDFNDLYSKFLNFFLKETRKNHLKILNFHPELAIEKIMTNDSKMEQASSKLDTCSKEEFDEFLNLNKNYKKKFNFPFIISVAKKNKIEILENFRKRIKNNEIIEFNEAIQQVKKIASIRLEQIIKNIHI